MKRLFKWALRLFVLLVVLIVAGVLLLNTIVKELIQSRLRAETGMEVKIGKIDIGLTTPTIDVEDFKLYNSPEFGGSPFLDLPEIYIEYDKDAIRRGQLHLRLLRLNIAEIGVVQNKNGGLNLQGLAAQGKAATTAFKVRSRGLTFTGIDTLNVSLQKMRVTTLGQSGRPEEINFNLTNEVFPNIKTKADWEGVAVILAGRGAAASPSDNSSLALQKLVQQILKH